jgi:ribose 5-phosphate isomerase A
MSADQWKRQAAERALTYVEDGMLLGLGTGSTAAQFVDLLGERVAGGLKVQCVATSEVTAAQARRLGILLTTLDEHPILDLTVDGADECDGQLQLIKGGGAALLREKIVAAASEQMIVIADHTKLVKTLGAFALPVEVVAFGLGSTKTLLQTLAADVGCEGEIRQRRKADGSPLLTDSGNFILDCAFTRIEDAESLDAMLKLVPGIVEHGLFLGLASKAIFAGPDGVTEIDAPDDNDY